MTAVVLAGHGLTGLESRAFVREPLDHCQALRNSTWADLLVKQVELPLPPDAAWMVTKGRVEIIEGPFIGSVARVRDQGLVEFIVSVPVRIGDSVEAWIEKKNHHRRA